MFSMYSNSKRNSVLAVCAFIILFSDFCLAGSSGFDRLIKEAEAGDPYRQYQLAQYYQKGEGLPLDYEEAVKWYRKSAEQGFMYSQNALANLYFKGVGVVKSYEKAVEWYEKAAGQGHADSQYMLGVMYEKGHGLKQDIIQAIKWYEKSAVQKNGLGAYKLGLIYESRKDLPENFKNAAKWFQKASDRGMRAAKYQLGLLYIQGKGVKKNKSRAMKLFWESADRGYKPAMGKLKELCPLYSLPGGNLLDAIYRNDMDYISTVDARTRLPEHFSVLLLVSNKYMYSYKKNWANCCRSSKGRVMIEKTVSTTVESKRYETLSGIDAGSVPGWTASAHYIVPQEFSFLLRKLGHPTGTVITHWQAKYGNAEKFIEGIDALQKKYPCDSSEIKQFEKNLIALTTQLLKKW